MIPKRRKVKMGVRNNDRSFPSHLRFIRSFVCLLFKNEQCDGRVEAHHVREGLTGGTGLKPPDYMTVPLCAKHHAELHHGGVKTFSETHKVDLLKEADRFAKLSPHRHKWEDDQ